MFEGEGIGRGILTIVHFFCMIALLPTRGRPAVDPRKIHGKVRAGIILRIVLFWVLNVFAHIELTFGMAIVPLRIIQKGKTVHLET